MKNKTPPERFDPPAHLSDASKRLWSEVVPRRARSPERLALVGVALQALDRAEAARLAIECDGMTLTTPRSGMTHMHPLIRVEKDAMATFVRAWTALKFEWCGVVDGIAFDSNSTPADASVLEYEKRKKEFEDSRRAGGI